uniref:Ovule protein n=1 Tax=Heterorhabditis bacteriophora TaxID=37862 RepID=A0A1I7X6N6_HETBA
MSCTTKRLEHGLYNILFVGLHNCYTRCARIGLNLFFSLCGDPKGSLQCMFLVIRILLQ